MKRSRIAVGGVAAVALTLAIGPALAQEAPPAEREAPPGEVVVPASGAPIDPGVYTAEVVHPMAPFHTPTINVDTVNLENIGTTLEPLNPAQLLEVRQRCSTIVANVDRYTEAAQNFCRAVFSWVAINRPDAPNTDEELAAMQAAP
jgi:hypothetical protein